MDRQGPAAPGEPARRHRPTLSWLLAAVGLAALVAAVATHRSAARSAAAQDWPPFVLVSGLLLIGLVADDDGLFAAVGQRVGRAAPSGIVLFAAAVVIVGVVTALLNLDTAVAFLTPVLIYAARSRGGELRCCTDACSARTPGRCSYPAPT
jgi:arsenical pump membrane protein